LSKKYPIKTAIIKELRDNIASKHETSKVYREPPQLFTSGYHFLGPERKFYDFN
jgi:hypothetical protein